MDCITFKDIAKMPFNLKRESSLFVASLMLAAVVSCTRVNTVNDPHFDKNGYCLDSAKSEYFEARVPKDLKIYVEVSGSMNGFFRSNQATRFKKDVWSVVSSHKDSDVYVLSNSGAVAQSCPVGEFRSKMNQGRFVSNQETLVPAMLETILDGLDYSDGQCAVLISDMKYSPETHKDAKVLLEQYQADVRNQIAECPDLAVSLIMAKSDYLTAKNAVASENSPYYYVIFGKDENVAYLRNQITAVLENSGNYGDCIEMGFDYKSVKYSFDKPDNAFQLVKEPTFISFDTSFSDTCTINLNLDLSDYRSTVADESVLRKYLSVKSCYGSGVSLGKISVRSGNEPSAGLSAKVEIKVYDMIITKSDVIEWAFNQPDTLVGSEFGQMMSAERESDFDGSFSLDRFVAGVYEARPNVWDTTPNRILVSQNN